MGNGIPISAVVFKPELLVEFGKNIRYFNTFGGNSVAIAAAQAVLNVICEESLMENALKVGSKIQRQAPLPETAGEACAVGRDLGAKEADIYLGERANEAQLKALSGDGTLRGYRVLHFATHGLVAGETSTVARDLSEPSLILTPPDKATETNDGLLTASEIAGLSLNAEAVVLSACNTASASGAPNAEALSGLGRAFFYAGARALLVTHWYVTSDAAVELVTKSFAERKSHPEINLAEALRRAMQTSIDRGGMRAHPAWWAPFVVVAAD